MYNDSRHAMFLSRNMVLHAVLNFINKRFRYCSQQEFLKNRNKSLTFNRVTFWVPVDISDCEIYCATDMFTLE